jgi:hypothetical protein
MEKASKVVYSRFHTTLEEATEGVKWRLLHIGGLVLGLVFGLLEIVLSNAHNPGMLLRASRGQKAIRLTQAFLF